MKIKNYIRILLLSSLSLGLISCNSGSKARDSSGTAIKSNKLGSKSSQNLKDDFFMMLLGSGYNSVTGKAVSGQSCLRAAANPQNIYVSNPTGIMDFDLVKDMSEFQHNLGVDVSGQLGPDRFSMSMEARFANAAKGNNYTTNYIYMYKYAGKARFIDGSLKESDAALTPTAAGMVHHDQIRFQEMCGDKFVEQMDAGATLAIKLSLGFNSHSDQQKFNSKLKGDLGIANIATTIQQAAANANVHVDFSLSALQLGGEPQNLNDIFGELEPNGNYPYINCGSINESSNLQACNHMMSAIIAYGQTIKSQVANPDGTPKLLNLYYSNPMAVSYSSIGVKIGAIDPSAETLQAMRDLTRNYDKTIYDYTFVTHYLSALRGILDTPTQSNLRDAANRLSNQINNVYMSQTYKVLNCYKNIVSDDCSKIKRNVDQAVAEYALNRVESVLLDYLETTSYSADLYTYNGGNSAESTGYTKAQNCVLAPISAPNYARYAVNCDGNWLYNPSGYILINENGIKGGINISDLTYYSQAPNGGQVTIKYPDIGLSSDAFDPNYFYRDQISVQVESANMSPYFLNTDIGVTREYQNQA